VIAYIDSSVLVRSYLEDEQGHEDVLRMLHTPDLASVTGTWTRIEVSGALMRAAHSKRVGTKADKLLALLDADLGSGGRVTELSAPQVEVERTALKLVREHALRALDAWHLAVAAIAVPPLASPGEEIAFASRDETQRAIAEQLGFRAL
jgi:uncharacterized protein